MLVRIFDNSMYRGLVYRLIEVRAPLPEQILLASGYDGDAQLFELFHDRESQPVYVIQYGPTRPRPQWLVRFLATYTPSAPKLPFAGAQYTPARPQPGELGAASASPRPQGNRPIG